MAENITEFREMDENGNNIPEETPKASTTQPDAPKKGLLALWKNLKWWQRAAVIMGTATLIYVGGKWIFKGRKKAEREAITKCLDEACNQQVKVVTPMDPVNNAADAAVQGLVNEFAKSAEEAGTNVVNF